MTTATWQPSSASVLQLATASRSTAVSTALKFIDAHRSRFGGDPICRTLGIAPSTYYARRSRPPRRRQVEDAALLERIRAVHEHNHGVYGSRRVPKALRRQGVPVARCRVER